MRLRVLSDDHTAFLFQGSEVKAFVGREGRTFVWGVMPRGPGGEEGSPEEALAAIRMAIEQGEDVVLDEQRATMMHLPPMRSRQLRQVGTFEVLAPVSGLRELARTIRAAFARATKLKPSEKEIRAWMLRNLHRFVDRHGEVNATQMVEAWDSETQDGAQTLDSDHVAWDVAAQIALERET